MPHPTPTTNMPRTMRPSPTTYAALEQRSATGHFLTSAPRIYHPDGTIEFPIDADVALRLEALRSPEQSDSDLILELIRSPRIGNA